MVTDDNYDEWKIGDLIVWEDEANQKTPVLKKIEKIDEYGRVFWKEGRDTVMTRLTNMLRVRKDNG